MRDADAQLAARETRRHGADLDIGELAPEKLVVGALHLENLRDRLEEESRPHAAELGGERLPVVGEPHDVLHD